MADSYLAISQVAADVYMNDRVRACAAQQHVDDPVGWTFQNQYKWASSPSWGEKWESALASHPPEPPDADGTTPPAYQPGTDLAVISDADILATVQFILNTPAGITSEVVA